MINAFERVYNSGISQKYMKWAQAEKTVVQNGATKQVSNYSKLEENFPLFLMTWIPLVQCGFFATSKKMPEDKKYSLIFNELYTAVVGIAITLLFRKQIGKLKDKFLAQAEKLYVGKKSPEEIEMLKSGMKKAVPAAFTVMFCQYLAPVLTTPLATKTSQYFMKKGKSKDPNEQKPLDKNV